MGTHTVAPTQPRRIVFVRSISPSTLPGDAASKVHAN
jgi:hypothetical protein